METKNGVKIFGGTFILFFISLSILSGCGLFEKEKKDNSNGNQTQMQKFTDIFIKPPLFDSSKQKYSTSKRIYPKSSSVSVWEKVISLGGGWFRGRSIIQSSDRGYVVAGWTHRGGLGGYDMYVVKLDSSGNVQWTKTIGGSGSDAAWSIIQSSDGGYVVAGDYDIGTSLYVVKLAPDGTTGCHDRFQSPIVSTGGIVTDAVSTSYSITPESYSVMPIVTLVSPFVQDLCLR